MSLSTLGANLLRNMLAGKEINRAGYDNKGDSIIRADYGFSKSEKF